jgi:hypothetical protein
MIVKCFIVKGSKGEYDSYEERIESVWFDQAKANTRVGELYKAQKRRHHINREFFEIEEHEISG